MTPEQTPHRQELPIQIGPHHGYRIDGDSVFVNADLLLSPRRAAGSWTLELWASEQVQQAGEPLTGIRVARVAVNPPVPIAPTAHRVEAQTDARLPLQGRRYHMALAVLHQGPDGTTHVDSFVNYPDTNTFIAPHFEGGVAYRLTGHEVVLEADGIFNPRGSDNLSGSLAVELWAFPEGNATGQEIKLAVAEVERLAGGTRLTAVSRAVAFQEPPPGRYRLALLLAEWTRANGYVVRDRRDFTTAYQNTPSVIAPPVAATTPVTTPSRPAERLRLVPPPASVASPDAPRAVEPARAQPTLVSIQTADVDQLAGVKGLNRKLALEIIKARPFTSLADLVRVRGIGPKTLEKLKTLVTL